MNKMEIFQKNLEEANFSKDFVIQSLHYFNELKREGEIQGLNVEDTLYYFNVIGSFTCNTQQSETTLINLRKDLSKLKDYDYNNVMNFKDYFNNIENFELQVIFTLFYEFYPQEEDDEEENE